MQLCKWSTLPNCVHGCKSWLFIHPSIPSSEAEQAWGRDNALVLDGMDQLRQQGFPISHIGIFEVTLLE